MNRLKILHIIDAISGGAGVLGTSIACGTPEFSHHFLALPGQVAYEYGMTSRLKSFGVKVHHLHEIQSTNIELKFGLCIRDIAPNLIIHHWWQGCKTESLIRQLRLSSIGAPLVLISHNNDHPPNNYDYYISVSSYNSKYGGSNFDLNKELVASKHRLIRNAVEFRTTGRRVFQDKGHSLRASSLQPFKIREDWISFVSTIGLPHKQHTIIGDGAYLSSFRTCARNLQAETKVLVTGPLANGSSEFAQVQDQADVFLQESVKPEAGSLAILEALSAGIPVISDGFGCLKEFVTDGVNGIIVASRDELRDATMYLLGSRGLWRRLSDGARESAAAYNLQHMLGEYRVLFYDALHLR